MAGTQHAFECRSLKQELNQLMQYVTITFHPRDAPMLAARFATLPPYYREVQTKKYLWSIPGLISRSFQYPYAMLPTIIQPLFFSRYYLLCVLM